MKYYFLSIILILLVSCNSSNTNKENQQQNPKNETVVVVEDSTDFYTITASYPAISLDTGNVIEQFINNKLTDQKELWKVGGVAYTEEMTLRKEFPERTNMKYSYSITYDKFSSEKYQTTSFLFNEYTFNGGANGNTVVYTFTFDKNGKRLDIAAVLDLNNNNDIKLSKILAEEALKNDTIQFDKEMLYNGLGLSYLKADGVTLDKEKCKCDGYFFGSNLQNFIIKDTGITFIFSRGQIAAGAVGTPEINISWDKLSPFLMPNSL